MAPADDDESLRWLIEWDKERHRKRTEEAHANGFTCWEDYGRSLDEKARIRHEEVITAHCATTGKTREEVEAELFQQESPNCFLPMVAPCDCKEHAFPLFCPQSLVDYRSQDIPDLMAFLNSRHHLRPEALKIEEGEKSKRLDQEILEKCWTQESQGAPMRIPFWANADEVLQQVIRQDACQNPSISPSPSPLHTPSVLHDEPVRSSPSAEAIVTASTNTSTELESENQAPRATETPLSELSKSVHTDSHSEERRPQGYGDKLAMTRPKAHRGATGYRFGGNSRITKRSWRPAMGLRSRKATKFYELARDGSAISPGR
ncbi:MAG: hypothetical protein Q9225_000950 [Loekoesia sp. 1 TL-2023]